MGNETEFTIAIDGRRLRTTRGALAAADVLELGGMPRGVVIRIDGGHAVRFDPDEPVSFDAGVVPAFRTFPGGDVRRLSVDGQIWEWGMHTIYEHDVRRVAGVDEDWVVFHVGQSAPVRRGGCIDLSGTWPPQLELRDGELGQREVGALVPIILNGRSLTLNRDEVSFEDLVKLAFPGSDLSNPATRALTVTYRRGPPARPEGALTPSERIGVRSGEVFNVTATTKS